MSIESRVIDVIKKTLKSIKDFKVINNNSEIKPEASFFKDLGVAEFGFRAIIMALEKKFYLDISESDVCKLHTVQDVIDLIEDSC